MPASEMQPIRPVFIAHSSQDKAFVRRLVVDISLRGVRVWFDEWEIKVGESITRKISEGIDASGWLTVVFSEASVRSEWVTRELGAGLMRELEEKSVFVLPIRIDDAPAPALLRDKRYADFRIDYDRGLEELLRTVIPDGASSGMLQSVPELRLHLLPAVLKNRLLDPFDLNRIIFAINLLERTLGIGPTNFPLFRKGQRLFAHDINQFLHPIDVIRGRLTLPVNWDAYPVSDGHTYTAGHVNELYGKINEAIDALLQRPRHDA
jgi:hypothetical protein